MMLLVNVAMPPSYLLEYKLRWKIFIFDKQIYITFESCEIENFRCLRRIAVVCVWNVVFSFTYFDVRECLELRPNADGFNL